MGRADKATAGSVAGVFSAAGARPNRVTALLTLAGVLYRERY